jgi:hypothetical protein
LVHLIKGATSRSASSIRTKTKPLNQSHQFAINMPANLYDPTYIGLPWCIMDDWHLQFRATKSKRKAWQKKLGQVTECAYSASFRKTNRDAKQAVLYVRTTSMSKDEPRLCFSISELDRTRGSVAVRTKLGLQTDEGKIASTSHVLWL